MKLNEIEKALMNNPVRALLQWQYEAPLLARLGGRIDGLRALEIGCGRGIGAEIILERFGARQVYGFDLDIEMVRQARRRLARRSQRSVHLGVADAAAIPALDESYDAVFDFGVLPPRPRLARRGLRDTPGPAPWRAVVLRRGDGPGAEALAVPLILATSDGGSVQCQRSDPRTRTTGYRRRRERCLPDGSRFNTWRGKTQLACLLRGRSFGDVFARVAVVEVQCAS